MAMHVRFNSWYISSPFSAKQQREMTKFWVMSKTCTTTANFVSFYFKFIAASQIHFRHSLRSKRFRGVGEQRKSEERDFRRFGRAKNDARAQIRW